MPIKSERIASEPFSLSCPPRLVVRAGESVPLSCSATGVPEEGVRYEWESIPGGGLDLLDASDKLSPLFTAPLSGNGAEYFYRLTATGPGVHAVASVTVAVKGLSGQSVGAPGLQEECDPFMLPENLGEGCPEDKGPIPFGFGPEKEFLLPEAPGAPAPPSGPGFGRQAPPRLECPAAVFLEELEASAIECHAWDAAGEEYLEYFWEPVGSTTRDYLENPRLFPENSLAPSVIAPEAPAHETLESFRSEETTLRYRYRLTATSRATGLSSHEEVEVFVSSSRPSVYCPLEIVVEEGDTVSLDCEGADPLSFRMDYDEEAASVLWEWEGLWGASTTHLDEPNRSSPLFTAPAGSAGKEYHYIASMTSSASGAPHTARRRVTVKVAVPEEKLALKKDSGEEQKAAGLDLICSNSLTLFPDRYLYSIVETKEELHLDCKLTGELADATYNYTWSGPGVDELFSDRTIPDPVFYVPDVTPDNTYYKFIYVLEVQESSNSTTVTYDFRVEINVVGQNMIVYYATTEYILDEGDEDFKMVIIVTVGNPSVFATSSYSWMGDNDALGRLRGGTNILTPEFEVPGNVTEDTIYEYVFRVDNPQSTPRMVSANITVTVRDTDPSLKCTDHLVYEGADDFDLDCFAEDEEKVPSDAAYAWAARGDTPDTALLNLTDIASPTFYVPDEVDETTTYEYSVTLSGSDINDVTEYVSVIVLNKPDIVIICPGNPYSEYEGEDDFDLDCSASGTPEGSTYDYVWTARGDTPDTDLLSAMDIASPTFDVPDDGEIDANTDYEYTLAVSAENAEPDSVDVTVTVLKKTPLALTCVAPDPVYEGAGDFDLDCEASGAPPGSGYTYEWTGDATALALLTGGVNGPSPTFAVPDDGEINADTDYTYTLTASALGAHPATAEVVVTVLKKTPLALTCIAPDPVYEGAEDFDLDCEASGAPPGSGYTYEWTGDATALALLTGDKAGPFPTFAVPGDGEINADTDYTYTLTVSAFGAYPATAEVTVTVLNKPDIALACTGPAPVYEGSPDFDLNCEASGAPAGSSYTYAWTARDDTQDTSLLSAADIASPTFYVPDEVAATTIYRYLLTARAENAEDGSAEVTVTVLNEGALAVVCEDPAPVYEGSPDFDLNCEASGAPAGSSYTYAWTARDDTQNTSLLSAADIASPTFYVPDEVAATTIYRYLLTARAENAEDGSAEVAVTVLNKNVLAIVCMPVDPVYEGSEDFDLDCKASGAPPGSEYTYAWTARGDTQGTSLLSATDIASPTFYVPDEVAVTTYYSYLVTVAAENAKSSSADVTVAVLNRGELAVVCRDPGSVYEGSANIAFDCKASGAPAGSTYDYAWTARGGTQNTSLLSATDIASPTFYVPKDIDGREDTYRETYEYRLTASAENIDDVSADIVVVVLEKPDLRCFRYATPTSVAFDVYEGGMDLEIGPCPDGWEGAPGNDYAYAWTARRDTPDTSLLTAADIPRPLFLTPDLGDLFENTLYRYRLTVSATNADPAMYDVDVYVTNISDLIKVACANPGSVYEGSEDFTLDCEASGAPAGSEYAYVWTARGDTQNTSLLNATDIASPIFYVPDEVDETTTYEYLLSVSAENAEEATAEVAVTVLDKPALAVACADPGSVYEGSDDIAFDCSASGAPGDDPQYMYVWTARGDTQDRSLLSATHIESPAFYVPDAIDVTTTYEYLLTVSAENADDAMAEVSVTVLNKEPLALACTSSYEVYEGSQDFALDCSASGAPGNNPQYAYAWTVRGDTQDTALLSATDIASPTFYVPEEVNETTTYEYLLTVSAENAEDAAAKVAVTVLDRVETPEPEPVSPPVADSSPAPSDPSALGVTVSASPLQFGVQSSDTEVSLDPMTDRITTQISGPHHAGRMTLSWGGDAPLDENGEMELSIELASPVALKRKGGVEEVSLALEPLWSYAESCEQLSSQAIGGLYTEITLSENDCRLIRFGGKLDLTGALPGFYAGNMDLILHSGEREETRSVEVSVTVVPAQRVITIGPGGVRFDTSREVPAGLTEEQNLSIYPDMAFLTEGQPDGVFELSNPSLVPLEVSVSARFGYTEATEDGREIVIEDTTGSPLGDLSGVVGIYPGVLVLQPGEKELVRYGVEEEAHEALEEKGYAAFFDVVSRPRRYDDQDRMPEEVSGDRTARVTMRVPGVYIPGEGASQLRATLLSISFAGSMSVTFLVETGDRPFVGEVIAYDGEGRELGRRETLIYTRSRVRVPLERMPEEEVVVLRFAPRGSDRVPEPVTIPWNAPGRDIGDAGEEGRTTPPATLVRKR